MVIRWPDEKLFIPLEEARLHLTAQSEIPIFRKLLGEDEVVLASRNAILASIDGS
jgi:hypothetical protein